MRFDFNFYSSLLLIFFSNGLLYCFLLLKKGIATENQSNKWLSLFVFLCSLYIAPWMLGFAGWYDNQPYRDLLFYVPMQHLFFLGPIIYFYIQSLLNPNFKLLKTDFWHLIPGIIYLVYSLIMVVTDKLILHKYYFLADGMDRDFDTWYQYTGFVSMVFYFVISLKYYQKFQQLMQNLVSFADNLLFKWIKTFLIAFLVMQLLQVAFFLLSLVFNFEGYVESWWYFLSFAIVMYYVAITGYSNASITSIPFQFDSFQNKKVFLIPLNENETVEEIDFEEVSLSETVSEELLQLKAKIIYLFETEKLSQNAELTLTEIAKKLNTNISVISKAVNQGFQMNFNDFVNQYRVEEVKKAFENGLHKKTTLLGIAYDCGFNSKATFNRAFKKNTGFSPKDFLKSA